MLRTLNRCAQRPSYALRSCDEGRGIDNVNADDRDSVTFAADKARSSIRNADCWIETMLSSLEKTERCIETMERWIETMERSIKTME